MTKPRFGSQCLKIGDICELRDFDAQKHHRKPSHSLCRIRDVQVGENGEVYVVIGWPVGNADESADELGYTIKGYCSVFPCDLRLA